ncbi:MAG: polysaccharide deacetylase family protein [Christensenellaceae bacterium]|jgi:polysaccharide deacetylase family sporulation protein PdaB|nr:polysaccharide deacetylase family protein [Christensenellaceae bacterium]
MKEFFLGLFLCAVIANPVVNPVVAPVYSVNPNDGAFEIALTFDDGCDDGEQVDALFNILDKYNAAATFFLIGEWAEQNPELVKKIAARGGEIASHAYTHKQLNFMSPEKIKEELTKSVSVLEKLTNQKITLFRSPYGEYKDKVLKSANELNLTSIKWNIDSYDWQSRSAHSIYSSIKKEITNGDIILMHLNGKNTLKALELLLKDLSAKNYKFLTVGDLISRGSINYKFECS